LVIWMKVFVVLGQNPRTQGIYIHEGWVIKGKSYIENDPGHPIARDTPETTAQLRQQDHSAPEVPPVSFSFFRN
jgi:hypothetical protein